MGKAKIKPMLAGKLMFPSEYIVAEDLDGRDVPLTISRVRVEQRPTDSGPQDMPFVYFEEMDRKKSDKRLGLNVTNARSIARLHGAEANDWVGCRITLFPTTCEAFGETVTCVRIRDKAPSSKAKPSAPEPGSSDEPDSFDPSTGEMSPAQEQAAFGDGE